MENKELIEALANFAESFQEVMIALENSKTDIPSHILEISEKDIKRWNEKSKIDGVYNIQEVV